MSLKRNATANFIGSFYLTAVNILAVPFYIKILGPEAYGLVGFFALMQVWLQMLDLGLTPTLAREVARQKAGAISAVFLRDLVKSFEYFFSFTGIIVAILLFSCSDWLASSWLKSENLAMSELKQSILLMSVIVPIRWLLSLYRSGLTGMEKHIWLNGFNLISGTMRAIGAIVALKFIGSTTTVFFSYQAILVVVEGIILISYFSRNLPIVAKKPKFSLSSLREVFPFAGSIAFTSIIWLAVSQSDKVILSNSLSLSDYGYFTLAITVASSVGVFSGPISKVLLPRLTCLISEKKEIEMIMVYRKATQFMVILTTSVTAIVAVFAKPLIFSWIGQMDAAESAAPVLFWYVIGNGILSILSFQYYLQFAYGNLKHHVVFNVVFAILWVPLVWYVALNYGALGAGRLWFFCQLVCFLFWSWYVHSKFAPGLHLLWLKDDVAPIVVAILSGLLIFYNFVPDLCTLSRPAIFVILTLLGIVLLFLGSISSSECRKFILSVFAKRSF
ncbi:MAG: polysaccharide biosynthesis protein [Flavobacterium sp.]|nr:polysaccharide biosynthesis protein [Flavobacterium sp.]